MVTANSTQFLFSECYFLLDEMTDANALETGFKLPFVICLERLLTNAVHMFPGPDRGPSGP